MASAQRRSGTRGRPPPKRCVLTWAGRRGCKIAHSSSEVRNPVVVWLLGDRGLLAFLVSGSFIPALFSSCVQTDSEDAGHSPRVMLLVSPWSYIFSALLKPEKHLLPGYISSAIVV